MGFSRQEYWSGVPLLYSDLKIIPNGNHSLNDSLNHWIFTGRADVEAEASILWPPNTKNQLIGKDPHAGNYWRQKEKGRQRMRWMALPTQWTWVWGHSERQWRAGKPGVPQCMGSQRVGQNLVAEQQQIINKASCPREIQFIFIAFDLLLEKMTKLNMIFPLVCKTFYCTYLLFAIWFCNCSYSNH